MPKNRSRVAAGSFIALMLTVVAAQAGTITGSIWENDATGAGDATPANIPVTTPNVTFTTNSNIAFASGNLYTIGEFLQSTPGGSTVLTGSGDLGDTLDNTLFEFTGIATVTNGETFTAGHDDGLTLIIDGITVIDAATPTPFVDTTDTYTGPTGSFAFQLVYGECCGAPGDLTISGLALQSTPEPSSLILFGAGLAGLGIAFSRRLAPSRVRR